MQSNQITNPYAPSASPRDRFESARIVWEGRQIKIRGEAVASRWWKVIDYTIEIDGAEICSNTQIRGTDAFDWQFTHKGGIAHARFEPLQWKRGGRLPFRLQIDGIEVTQDTIAVRGFRYWATYYFTLLLIVIVGLPMVLLLAMAMLIS